MRRRRQSVTFSTTGVRLQTSIGPISANADGPRDAALRKINNIVHTEYDYQAMSVGR